MHMRNSAAHITLYALSVAVVPLLIIAMVDWRNASWPRLKTDDGTRSLHAVEPGWAARIQGFGTNTVGGSGGRLCIVTSLADSGPDSLRECVENRDGPRIIKFAVAGTITLLSDLKVAKPFITIDGSDAPGGGIALRNGTLSIQTYEVIVRYIRVRSGPNVPNPGSSDAVRVEGTGVHNVVVDHCSISWALDENLSIVDGASDVTIQWCIISEGLNCNPTNPHPERCHSKCLFVSSSDNGRVSLIHNLIAHCFTRNPEVDSGDVEVVNNLVFNHGAGALGMELWEPVRANVLGNYFQVGADSVDQKYVKQIKIYDFLAGAPGSTIFAFGNVGYECADLSVTQTQMIEDTSRVVPARHSFPITNETDAGTARDQVLRDAGATLPCRDAVDERVIGNVAAGVAGGLRTVVPNTGQIIDDPSDVGGWPDLSASCRAMPSRRVAR
jgi:pectate lyase